MSKTLMQNFRHKIAENAPGICFALGLGSLVFATVIAVYETPKAIKAIEELDAETEDDEEDIDDIENDENEEDEENKRFDIERAKNVVKATWKYYIPSGISMTAGILLVLKSHSMMKNQLAAITVAYTGIDTAYKLYKKNAVDILGEKKEQEITDAVAKDRIKSSTPPNKDTLNDPKGTLCYDSFSDRYFRSDIETIRRAINDMNRYLLDECFVSLNEVYYEIGLNGVRFGDDIGWRVDDGLIDVSFSSQISNNNEPCLVVEFHAEPSFSNKSLY